MCLRCVVAMVSNKIASEMTALKTEIKRTVIMSKMNNVEQFGLSWILFKQSVFSSQMNKCVLIHCSSIGISV